MRNLPNLLPIFCQVEKNDGVTKWLAPEGLVGTHVAGYVGTTLQHTPPCNDCVNEISTIILLPLLRIIIIDVYR